ncbi:MAG: TetR/AcrR family transcriptional regulator [Treponemataceae bacterium]|nr:TetR/AcrR family transcriptional regulator [Treponemataceae bacterium]
MAIIVEHEKRKREILDKALDVFVEEGYEDATFQKIADKCGITRTTLYIYFKNKREIFMWSIKQLTEGLEKSLLETMTNENLTSAEILKDVVVKILEKCVNNRRLFSVLLTYLLQLQKTGKDPGERVRRRTIRLRHLLSKIIIDGINKGEFKDVNVKACNEMFYSLIESTVFRLAILDSENVEELFPSIELAIEGLKK